MMLAGLRSRWTTPASCASTSPRTTGRSIRSASGTDTVPSRLRIVEQVLALDEGHGDVLDAVDLAEVVDPHHVLVGDLAGQQQLPFEPPVELLGHDRVLRHLGADHLEGHRDIELVVPRLVDRAHAAETEQLVDPIAGAEGLPEIQRTGVLRRHRRDRGRCPNSSRPG